MYDDDGDSCLAFYRHWWPLPAGARSRRMSRSVSVAVSRARRCISPMRPRVAERSRHLGTSQSTCLERWRSSQSMLCHCCWWWWWWKNSRVAAEVSLP